MAGSSGIAVGLWRGLAQIAVVLLLHFWRYCCGISVALLLYCCGTAVGLPRDCHKIAVWLLHDCRVIAGWMLNEC